MILHAVATRLIVFDNGSVQIFEGTYQDFLDRGGWKDERVAASTSGQNAGQRDNSPNRRNLRRIKAELINSRSRILVPLQSRISEVEDEISQLEQKIDQDTQALIDVSVKGDGASIKCLNKSIHESSRKIETLFDELELLTDELVAKSREFEERLEAMKETGG
jgi:ATP-binding cassette, subfamily F, member 3